MIRYVATLLAVLSALTALAQRPAFPLKVSANGRYFTDQTGKPFLYHADTGWQLFARLTLAEAREYLTTRKQQGYNTIQVQVSMNPDSVNRAGHRPLIDYDFSKPNAPYFDHAVEVVRIADSLGMLINMASFWTGCCREGFGVGAKHEVYKGSGPAKSRQMGEYLGKRFGRLPNVVWTMGGDNDPLSIRAEIEAIAAGLRATAPQQLITFHGSPPHSSTDLFQYAPWLGFSMIYTYWREKPNEWVDPQNMPHVYEAALREYNKTDRMPFVLGESQYEGDGKRYGNDIGSPHIIRRQAYWTMLSGGAGHAYGHDGWDFPRTWREIIRYPAGGVQLGHFIRFFEGLPWWRLQPDQRHNVVIRGWGEFMQANYVTAALTDDAKLLVAYLPQPGRIHVDLSKLKGATLRARWFDPRTGTFTAFENVATTGVKQFTSPPQDDWVLVVEGT